MTEDEKTTIFILYRTDDGIPEGAGNRRMKKALIALIIALMVSPLRVVLADTPDQTKKIDAYMENALELYNTPNRPLRN